MPATILAHQALVLPLKLRWPRYFSGLALCIGSMAPDLEFIGRMSHDWLYSHTLGAQLWFSTPLTAALVWLLTRLVLPTLLPYLRDHPEWRLHDLAAIDSPQSPRDWGRVAYSAWIGGVSHVLLDGITHGNHSGWLVPVFPILRTPVHNLGGVMPLYDALQQWLSVLLAIVSVGLLRQIVRRRLLWQWTSRPAHLLPRQSRAAGWQLARVLLLASLLGGVTGCALHGDGDKATLAAVAFGAIDFAFVAAILAAITLRLRAPRVPGPSPAYTPSHTPS
jgi:hypothetical protein